MAFQEKESGAPDAWFTVEVIAKGSHVTVLVENIKVAEATIEAMADVGILDLYSITAETVLHVKKIEIKKEGKLG